MTQTKEGARKAAKTIKQFDPDFYRKIGAKGGRNGHTGGFASYVRGKDGLTGYERAIKVGRIGGMKSRRGKAKYNI